MVLSSFATLHDPNLNWSSRDETLRKLSDFQLDNLGDLYYFTPGLTVPAIFAGINRYNEILRNVAIQEETGWVDNGNLIPHAEQYFVDRVHFSAMGAKLMAENLAKSVEQLL